ncbi:MAG: hypothetical protein V7L06_22525 [Nostoc sp.]
MHNVVQSVAVTAFPIVEVPVQRVAVLYSQSSRVDTENSTMLVRLELTTTHHLQKVQQAREALARSKRETSPILQQ